MADHLLHLKGHPLYGWDLTCEHEPGGEWACTTENGEWESDDCWLRSWWEECVPGEIIDDRDVWPADATPPYPVDVTGDGWGEPPRLIPAREENDG